MHAKCGGLTPPPPQKLRLTKAISRPSFFFQFLVGLYLGTWILIETKYLQPKKRTRKRGFVRFAHVPLNFTLLKMSCKLEARTLSHRNTTAVNN